MNRRPLIIISATVLLLTGGWLSYNYWPRKSPLPAEVKRQLNFQVVSPTTGKADPASFNYQPAAGALFFKLSYQGKGLVVTEQAVPLAANKGVEDYAKALNIKPTNQFNSKLGPAAVADVYAEQHPMVNAGAGPQPVVAVPLGQAGILVTSGTLVIVRPDNGQKLTIDQWQKLFNSLKKD